MTPLVVHRYVLPAIDAVRALVDIGDCREVRISLESGVLVVDVVEPVQRIAPTVTEVTALAATETAVSDEAPDQAPTEPERKGGRLAQQAAIACGEKGFWTFLARGYGAQVETAEEAKAWLCEFCGISSRVDLDHEREAGERWREVHQRYRLWLDGYGD